MTQQNKLEWSLFLLRLGVFIVMAVWTLDKFINPGHAVLVFENFYMLPDIQFNTMYFIGAVQALIVTAFILGYKKRFSYGAVLFMHAVSTFSSFDRYLQMDMLFFAAWPMLAACVVLYLMREQDIKLSLEK